MKAFILLLCSSAIATIAADITPTITEAHRVDQKQVELRWTIKGDVSPITAFKVIRTHPGKPAVTNTVEASKLYSEYRALTFETTYTYRDFTQPGNLTYKVRAVTGTTERPLSKPVTLSP